MNETILYAYLKKKFSGGGGGGGEGGDSLAGVRFLDYDGTVVKSYSAEDFAALASLPANPSHAGLTAQGWNWSLEDAKTYVAAYGTLDIGQTYLPEDGKTKIKLSIPADAPSHRLTYAINFQQSVSGGVTVDWGDGSEAETYTGTSAATHTHTYAAGGDYDITLDVTSGSLTFPSYITGGYSDQDAYKRVAVRAVYFGNDVASIGNAFYNCYSLTSVVIPNTVTSIGNTAFYNCYSLASITIPGGVTKIGSSLFYNCYSLASISIPSSVTSIGNSAWINCRSLVSVTIPGGVTSIGNDAFSGCSSLASVSIPSGVTSIGNGVFQNCPLVSVTIPGSVTSIGSLAFSNCSSAGAYRLLASAPPALANANAFQSIPSDCVIYVPQGALTDYQAAANWSTYASHMQEEP